MGLGLPSVLPINGVKIQAKQKGKKFEKNPCLCRNRNLIQGQTSNDWRISFINSGFFDTQAQLGSAFLPW